MTSLLQSRLYQIGNKSNLHFGLMKTPQPASWVGVGGGGGGEGEETGGMEMGVPTERVVPQDNGSRDFHLHRRGLTETFNQLRAAPHSQQTSWESQLLFSCFTNLATIRDKTCVPGFCFGDRAGCT